MEEPQLPSNLHKAKAIQDASPKKNDSIEAEPFDELRCLSFIFTNLWHSCTVQLNNRKAETYVCMASEARVVNDQASSMTKDGENIITYRTACVASDLQENNFIPFFGLLSCPTQKTTNSAY